MNIEESFYKSKRLQMKILLGKSQVALRKCHTNNKALKAGNLKKDGGLESLLHYVEGYKFPKALRGSPAYFENAKRVLFAMIRQLYTASNCLSFLVSRNTMDSLSRNSWSTG